MVGNIVDLWLDWCIEYFVFVLMSEEIDFILKMVDMFCDMDLVSNIVDELWLIYCFGVFRVLIIWDGGYYSCGYLDLGLIIFGINSF